MKKIFIFTFTAREKSLCLLKDATQAGTRDAPYSFTKNQLGLATSLFGNSNNNSIVLNCIRVILFMELQFQLKIEIFFYKK